MSRFAGAAALIAIVIGAVYLYRDQVRTFAVQAYKEIVPCNRPITFSIERIDSRFDISTSSLERALKSAAGIWERGAGKPLFVYAERGGSIQVRLDYDTRQATTEKLRELGVTVENTIDSYESVRAEYRERLTAHQQLRESFDAAYESYGQNVDAYESEVRRWNARGGAPASVYEDLERQRLSLKTEEAKLRTMQESVNASADAVNALVATLNRLASELDLSADAYNTVGRAANGEFEEAVYVSSPGLQTITVYQFDTEARLTRVLAHEFGHALGLEHVEDSGAIMYWLNKSTDQTLARADIDALHALCSSRPWYILSL